MLRPLPPSLTEQPGHGALRTARGCQGTSPAPHELWPLRAPHTPPTRRVGRAQRGELSPQHTATTSRTRVACPQRCRRGERRTRGATAGAKQQGPGNPAVQTKRPPYVRNHSPVPSARQHNAPLCARETGLCTQRGSGRLSPRSIVADRNQMQEPAALLAPVAIGQLGHPMGQPGPRAGGFKTRWHHRGSPGLRGNARCTSREGVRRALGSAGAGIIQDTVQHPPAPKTDSQLYVRCLCAHHTWCRRSEAALSTTNSSESPREPSRAGLPGTRQPRTQGWELLLPLQQQSTCAPPVPTDRRRRSVCRKHRFLEASQRGERHDSSPAAEQEAALQGTRAAAHRVQELGQRGAVPHGAEAAWLRLHPSCLRHRCLPSASHIPTSRTGPQSAAHSNTLVLSQPRSGVSRPGPGGCPAAQPHVPSHCPALFSSVQPGQTPAALRGRLVAGECGWTQLSAPIPSHTSLLGLHPTERVSSRARARNWDSAGDAAAPFPDTDPTGRRGREGNSGCQRQPPSTSGRQSQGEGALPPAW